MRQLGTHRLICGDIRDPQTCRTLLAMSQDALPHDQATQAALRHVDISKHGRPALEVADMVFTDPPYNVPVDGHVCGSGSIKHKEFAFASGEMTSGAPTLVKIHIRVCCLSCMALGP